MHAKNRQGAAAQRTRAPWRRLLQAAGIALLLAQLPGSADAAGLFGWNETPSQNLAPFKKWTGVLQRYFAEVQQDFERKKQADGNCRARSFNRCHYERWEKLIASLEGKPLDKQLQAVNRYMNDVRYIVDPKNWGMPDYWATPEQFFRRRGDCEDYAIAKYLTLKRLGLPVERMRIVVLQDLNLGVAHAVLAVYADDGIMILDNQISRVVEDKRIRHYQPVFSINEQAWWLHTKTARSSAVGDGRRNHG